VSRVSDAIPRAAFVGARDLSHVPSRAVRDFQELAALAAHLGIELVTGAAPGADQMAATIAIGLGGRVHLLLPWGTFERAWVDWARPHRGVTITVYRPDTHQEWAETALDLHPLGRRLAPGPLALLARTCGIAVTSSLLVALPRDPDGKLGGTGFALRCARARGIPALTTWTPDGAVAAREALHTLARARQAPSPFLRAAEP
jgi:hypothetical protein